MWAEEGRMGLLQGAPPPPHLPCLQKPRSYQGQSLILDSGSMCRKGHSLLLHSPAGKPRHVSTGDSSGRAGPRPTSACPRARACCAAEGQVVLASGAGLADPETQGTGLSLFPDLYMAVKVLPSHVSMLPHESMTLTARHRVYIHQVTYGSIPYPQGVSQAPYAQGGKRTS